MDEESFYTMNRLSIIPLLFFVFSLVSPIQIHAACISGDCINGYGIFSWASGTEHEGNFVNGQANGKGIRKYFDGDKYIGEYKDGKKNGHGIYLWANGDKFVGEYLDGKRNGEGIKTYADGSSWTGEWRDDKRVWQPKKDCAPLIEYRDEGLPKDFEKAFDRKAIFDEANESLKIIKKDLISDTKTWYGLAGTNEWSVVIRTIAQRLMTTTNSIAKLVNINPVTRAITSIAGAATVTAFYVYEALLAEDSIQSISFQGLKVTYGKLILSLSGGIGRSIRTVWDLADEIKDGVYLPENHEQLKIDMDKALNVLSRELSLLERKIAAAKRRAYVVNEIKKGIDLYCNE